MIPRYTYYGVNPEDNPTCYKVMDMSFNDIPTSSGGGTSHAAPLTTGVLALAVSLNPDLSTRQLKNAVERTAELPRPTQVNVLLDRDARFGTGQVRAARLASEVTGGGPV